MESLKFEGFRFSVDDKVVFKKDNNVGYIKQCRFEIVSNKKDEYNVEISYFVNYDGYKQRKCKESELKYATDIDPKKEVEVLNVIIDANLLDGKYDYVKKFNDEKNNLK
jgi:hypothetical protein